MKTRLRAVRKQQDQATKLRKKHTNGDDKQGNNEGKQKRNGAEPRKATERRKEACAKIARNSTGKREFNALQQRRAVLALDTEALEHRPLRFLLYFSCTEFIAMPP
jgi:hypothetical protein